MHRTFIKGIIGLGLTVFSPSLTTAEFNLTHLLTEDGIGIGGVTVVRQDQRGFIWLGTEDGLRKFDGYDMQTIRPKIGSENAAAPEENHINAICFDSKHRIWGGTDRGLFLLQPDTKEIHEVKVSPSPASKGLMVQTIACDTKGRVWAGCRQGLYRVDEGASTPTKIVGDISVTALLRRPEVDTLFVGTRRGEVYTISGANGKLRRLISCEARIQAILQDQAGTLWIGTEGKGILRHAESRELSPLTLQTGNPASLPSNEITCLLEDSNQNIWIGTTKGLARCEPDTNRITRIQKNPDDSRTLPSNEIRCLYEDQRQVLWVGHTRGVSRFPLDQKTFDHVRHQANAPLSLSHDEVFGMLEDDQGRLWVGTEGGLNLRTKNGTFRHFKLSTTANESEFVYTIHQAPDGKLWLGTRGAGLVIFDPEEVQSIRLKHDPTSETSIPHNTITAITRDKSDRIWLGTVDGLAVVDSSGAIIKSHSHDPENPTSLSSNAISDILVTRLGKVFIATSDAGAMRFNPETQSFDRLDTVSGRITTLFEENNGQLWIGTRGSGVQAFDSNGNPILHLHHGNSDMPDNNVFGILQDNVGFLWFSTSHGIARLDPKSQKLRVFDTQDGLQSMVFHPKASCKDSAGKLYFGGTHGYNTIDPEGIPKVRAARQIVLSGLDVNGERVTPGADNPYLKRALAMTSELRMPFDQSRRISFNLATLDYTYPIGTRFRYRMKPVDPDWVNAGKTRKASYAGLSPGKYIFEAQSSLDGNRWNPNSARIKIYVSPPWYQTWWAISLFAIAGLGLASGTAFIVFKRQSLKIRREAEIHENERNKAEAALASQLQRAMLVQRTTYELQKDDSGSVFSVVLDRLNSHFRANCCVLYEYVKETSALDLVAEIYHGPNPQLSCGQISLENPIVQNVLTRREAIVSDDVTTDVELVEQAPGLVKFGIRSLLVIKTSFQGKTNGILFLLDSNPRVWDEDDTNLLETVADQIGVNLAHHRLTRSDLKQKEELEVARNSAEFANQAKTDFLAKMSHELRTPLNAILGFSEVLSQDVATTPDQRSTLDIINGSGEHLLQTINDILDMSKIESGSVELNKEAFDLGVLLDSAKNMLQKRAESKGLALSIACGDNVPSWILADKVKLRQILVNLVGNSIKFTESGGITIRVTGDECLPPSSMLAGGIPRRLHLEVIDTGSGISDEQIGKLFQKFSQTDSGLKSGQGTGLGLAISKSFVELMGGTITVSSELGVGTVFAFDICCDELPKEAAAKKKSTSGKYARLASGQDEFRVLIVEDQPANRMLLRTILQKRGFKVFEAENGLEGVKSWQSCDPHIIFMDNEMPVMNGMDATREIHRQAEGEGPCIVACTAYALDNFREQAKEAGCADFLAKPYQQEQLFEMIARHLPVVYEPVCA